MRIASPLRRRCGVALGCLIVTLSSLVPSLTETAIANGDTRTINLYHAHTQESISATYLVGGQYDRAVLQQLNWFLRDWRRDEPTNMDPRLFDVVWEAYRQAGAGGEVVKVVSAYRSPETNAMLRRRSRAVAKYSQHMLGKAMDTTIQGMPMSRVREVGMRMQRGGVGYYPTAGTPFVHLDVGNVRSWPRMSYDQLVQLFPDGKTVHLPTNGQPLARYEEARAEIEARGNGAFVAAPRRTVGGFFAALFGGGSEEEEDTAVAAPAPSTRKQWASLAPRMSKSQRMAAESDEESAAPAEKRGLRGRSETIARAESNLPQGETVMTAAPDAPPAESAPAKPAPTVRAPLPPERPASLDKPTPLETPTAVASLEGDGARGLRGASDQNVENAPEATTPVLANVPVPPRRPATLVARGVDAPLPPQRPASTVAAVSVAPEGERDAPAAAKGENAAKALATLVEKSPPDGASANDDREALAYASGHAKPGQEDGATPVPPTRPADAKSSHTDVVPARLDRSNFRTLTGATPTSRTSGGTVLGSSIGAMRSAARAAEPSVLSAPHAAKSAGFGADVPLPPTDRFSSGR